ncbi:MAG TPA: hypothetical protein VH277_00630, partial [Gemmatimonadaceae bacterium]|nr:hypothetical protein [Gemmatimonadaceae bacterium]
GVVRPNATQGALEPMAMTAPMALTAVASALIHVFVVKPAEHHQMRAPVESAAVVRKLFDPLSHDGACAHRWP